MQVQDLIEKLEKLEDQPLGTFKRAIVVRLLEKVRGAASPLGWRPAIVEARLRNQWPPPGAVYVQGIQTRTMRACVTYCR